MLDFQINVLMKLDTILERQNEGLGILRQILAATKGRSTDDTDIIEDILPKPLETPDQMKEFCCQLDDDSFKKKLVRLLSPPLVTVT